VLQHFEGRYLVDGLRYTKFNLYLYLYAIVFHFVRNLSWTFCPRQFQTSIGHLNGHEKDDIRLDGEGRESEEQVG
jgi:hypothetical protein